MTGDIDASSIPSGKIVWIKSDTLKKLLEMVKKREPHPSGLGETFRPDGVWFGLPAGIGLQTVTVCVDGVEKTMQVLGTTPE